MTVPDSILTHS